MHSIQSIGLDKTTSNLFRHRKRRRQPGINLSDFNQIVFLDTHNQFAELEGMTTYEDCVQATLPHGVMPTVVPELKTITIGGAATGIGIESSSFRYGLVHETIAAMDILLSDGRVVSCTGDNEHKDLFYAFPNSYGTLGYALKVTIRVQPVKQYVELTHHRFDNTKLFLTAMEDACRQEAGFQFVDGVTFGNNEMVLSTGKFVDTAPFESDYTYMSIYYQSLKKKTTDYLTSHDYIWRWDTDWFWCSKHFFLQYPIIRFLFGKNRLRSTTYWGIRSFCNRYGITHFLEKISSRKEAIIQDVEIPMENSETFLDFFHQNIGITPIWVCPTRVFDAQRTYDLYPMDPDKLYINFGFWDVIPTTESKGYFNRLLEEKVEALEGKKSLYSDSYYTEKKFWQLYNGDCYRRLKEKYDAQGQFKDLYSKCVVHG